ncbi:hypothetical protein MOMA_05180 [Moraxella macacae 0408225]|uniref:YecA family protein n=1 Tax=Moraxella macacae 0408225 TaxID=1230338 RepID=L2FBE9_9GAMM|nr:UPF0149 family protein [Moraxella macacae]ELA09768.1 hypothetical protein MOMA_05180 [Moraxella macacae 0408225]
MNDYLSGWQDWHEALQDWHDVSVSELHGLITGVLSVCDAPTPKLWQALLTELSFTELEPKALKLISEEGEDLAALLTDDEDSYQFLPLLPDDEHPLYERLQALKNWANGYLTGFGVTDSALRSLENTLFHDLAKVGALRIDVFDENLQGNDNPEGELQYMELLEFVRMIPVSVANGRVRKSVAKLPLIAGFAMTQAIGKTPKNQPVSDFIDNDLIDNVQDFDNVQDLVDDELDWQHEKDHNDEFVTNMVIDAMTGKKPS